MDLHESEEPLDSRSKPISGPRQFELEDSLNNAMAAKRAARLAEFKEEALDDCNASSACVGGVIGGLLETAAWVEDKIADLMSQGDSIPFAELSNLINAQMMLTRQIERYFELRRWLQDAHAKSRPQTRSLGSELFGTAKRLK
jgi:hypothetical protein